MPDEKIHPNVAKVTDAARNAGFEIQVKRFPEGTKTAQDAATAIGVTVGQIVKSLVFGVDDEIVMALVSGSNQLDEKKLATAAGGAKCKRVDADAVREATGFPIGGVPPFGHSTQLRVFVDPDLLQYPVSSSLWKPSTVCFQKKDTGHECTNRLHRSRNSHCR